MSAAVLKPELFETSPAQTTIFATALPRDWLAP
jgi:hypothetical protein